MLFAWPHYQLFRAKKKMLFMRQDALENLIKYEETNLLTTNDAQTTIAKSLSIKMS